MTIEPEQWGADVARELVVARGEIERLRAALSETTAERDAARTALQASIRIAGTARARAIYDEQTTPPKEG